MKDELEQVARLAMRRYLIRPEAMAQAMAEVERARALGGLVWLGSVLEQRRVICAGQALELNGYQRGLREDSRRPASRRLLRVALPSTRDAAVEAIRAAFDRIEPKLMGC